MAGEGSKQTQFKGKGVGLVTKSKSLCFKIPQKYEDVILQLDNRSERIREWVIRGMVQDGLIED